MFNTDIATGQVSTVSNYSSTGPSSAWSLSELPSYNKTAKCYLWDVMETCTQEDMAVLYSGSAIVGDWVLVGGGNGTGNGTVV